MLVPVVVASKHGATTGLGEAVARTLEARGIVAPVREAGVPRVSRMRTRSSWAAPSTWAAGWNRRGPSCVTTPPSSSNDRCGCSRADRSGTRPLRRRRLTCRSRSRLSGLASTESLRDSLDKKDLGIGERTMVRVVHAPEGDFRDWAAVSEWAEQIADALLAESRSAGG